MRRLQTSDTGPSMSVDGPPTKVASTSVSLTDSTDMRRLQVSDKRQPLETDKLHFYCINLRHRTDRWNAFVNQPAVQELQKQFTFERFDAIQGSSIDIPNDPRVSMRTKRNIQNGSRRDHEDLNTAGGVGCYLSHVEVWKKIANNPEPYGIVFEDDTEIRHNFLTALKECIKDLNLLPDIPDVWTFSRGFDFYYRTKGRISPVYEKNSYRGPWIYNTCPGGLNGYLLTKEGAKKLLETVFPIDMHVDLYICLNVDLKRVTCVSHQALVLRTLSESIKSDIQLPSGCAICDVPTNFDKRGFVLLHMPLTVTALVVMSGLLYLNVISKGRMGKVPMIGH